MRNLWRTTFCCLLLLLALSRVVRADITPEALDKAKRATALVEVGNGRKTGSAFCIDNGGFFITNNHVVADSGADEISLILRSGEKDQRKLKARVIRTDAALDLALLVVKKPGSLTALPLGEASGLIETASVTTFGYPFGKQLSLSKDEYPSITVSIGHITSLRKVQGELREVQFDASVNPGNSGGPVLDSKGQVIGVVVAGIVGSGINFAIPVPLLTRFLEGVSLALSPSLLTARQAQEAQEFEIKIAAFRRSTVDMTAELILSTGADDHRKFAARAVDASTFKVKAAPLPVTDKRPLLRLTIQDARTEIVCLVRDQKLLVGGMPTSMSALTKIERGEKTIVSFVDKEIREASVTGLEEIEAQLFGMTTRLNLSRADSITIAPAEPSLSAVSYRIVVRQAGKTVGELTGQIPIAGSTGEVAALPKRADIELLLINYVGGEVKRFNGRTGAFIDDFASGSGLTHPAGLVIGPDGNLYVSSEDSHTIIRYDGRTGQFMDNFVTQERNGGLNSPHGLAFGPDGNLYVCSTGSHAVKRYNGRTGTFMDDFVGESGGLEHPSFLMFGPDGNLYVNSSPRVVKRFNGRTGAYMGDFVSSNGINGPAAFCFGKDGRFYLACCEGRQIKRFDSQTGAFIDNFVPTEAIGNGNPIGLNFGPDGNLYANINGTHEVRRFNGRTGEYIDTFIKGNSLNYPYFMLFRPAVNPPKPPDR